MRAMLLFTAATLPLGACDIQKTSGDDKSVNITAAENGAVSFQVPGVTGNIKLPSSMMAHSDMDIDGVKLFPGSHVTNVRAEDQDVLIGFTAPGTVAELKAYYAREFADKKVNAIAQGNGFGGKTGDGSDFTLSFAEANKGTAGTMKIHDKD